MCQLLGLSSSAPVRMTFDWKSFVMRGSDAGGNPDGWGVAYFEGSDALVLRESTPAASSPMVQYLDSNAPRSDLIISHVRRATAGERRLANTQPFARTLGGRRHVFAHNGFVPTPEAAASSAWLMPRGDTDSERLFCHLLGDLESLWANGGIPRLEERYAVILSFAREILQRGAANFLYSDGITLFAHGHRQTLPGEAVSDQPGLYLSLYKSQKGSDMSAPCLGVRTEGSCSHQALVATEPLNDREWTALTPGEIACFERGQRIR